MTDRLASPADLDDVRASYDAVADNYVAMGIGDLGPEPWLRAALDVFAERVRDVGPVLDAGCGPGQVTAYLHERGVDVHGIDLSPPMVELAQKSYPHLTFEAVSVTDVELVPRSLGGVLGWWSWFNLPRAVFPDVVRRTAAALRPGGLLLIGTHRGTGDVERTVAYGDVPVRWTTHLYEPDDVIAILEAAGLRLEIDFRFPAAPPQRAQLVVIARRPPLGPVVKSR